MGKSQVIQRIKGDSEDSSIPERTEEKTSVDI